MKYSKLQTSSCFTFYKGNKISANHNGISIFGIISSCFTFYKGNKISANHNSSLSSIHRTIVVSPSTKVIKFQLITTHTVLWFADDCCFTFYKGNKISANHNKADDNHHGFQLFHLLQR